MKLDIGLLRNLNFPLPLLTPTLFRSLTVWRAAVPDLSLLYLVWMIKLVGASGVVVQTRPSSWLGTSYLLLLMVVFRSVCVNVWMVVK